MYINLVQMGYFVNVSLVLWKELKLLSGLIKTVDSKESRVIRNARLGFDDIRDVKNPLL